MPLINFRFNGSYDPSKEKLLNQERNSREPLQSYQHTSDRGILDIKIPLNDELQFY